MRYVHSGDSFNSVNDRRISSVESLRERNGLILGTNIFEPMAGREDTYCPYEVPPIFIPSVRVGEKPGPLVLHQEYVIQMHDELLDNELADKVTLPVLEFIRNSIHTRMVEQIGLNSHCFSQRLNRGEETHVESCDAALVGLATVAQAAEARAIFGMASAPLAEITIVGDKRLEHLPSMMRDVSQLVGGDISEVEPYRIEVIGFDRDPDESKAQHPGAMRVKMKRRLGKLEDGTEVKQRTLAIIDLSKNSGIDKEIIKAIFDAYTQSKKTSRAQKLGRITLDSDQDSVLRYLHLGPYSNANKQHPPKRDMYADPDAGQQVSYAALPEVDMMLRGLIARDMKSHIVLARNETVYAYNQDTDKLIHSANS